MEMTVFMAAKLADLPTLPKRPCAVCRSFVEVERFSHVPIEKAGASEEAPRPAVETAKHVITITGVLKDEVKRAQVMPDRP